MTEQFKAAFPAVDWRWDSETGGLSGRNRRTWVYIRPYKGGYQAWAELEHRGQGWSLIPEEAVRAALKDLSYETKLWADRVADALDNWGKP